jgi:asparagine synthase (glutamine-hydrolysing)
VCGIAAIVGAASRQSGFGKMPVMLQHLAHRGDQPPTWKSYGSAALGSVRLAIVDVERGVQPMESRNLAITFNGEIYNHVELRNQLRAEGLSFATECDTEVLLQGYSRWGEGLLDRIEGMYAFVLVDLAASSFIAARDPFWHKAAVLRARRRRLVLFIGDPAADRSGTNGHRRGSAGRICPRRPCFKTKALSRAESRF